MKSIDLSAVIIAKNEQERISLCLDRLTFAGERIVVDNGSADETAKIAVNFGATVVSASSNNFSTLRSIGLAKAKGSWILYVDADELIPEVLAQEILHVITSFDPVTSPIAYYIKRNNYYLGNNLWPVQDQVERLFVQQHLKGWHGQLHESPIVEGLKGTLVHPLDHYTHRTLEEMVAKTNEWSIVEAGLRFETGHPSIVPWRLFRVMATAFFRSFITRMGWRAKTEGLIESMYQAFSMFITYAKLWEMQQ